MREGETSYVVVELTDERPARVNGRLTVNSAPAAGWTVCAWPGDVHSFSGELPNTALDEHGEFTLSLDDPGLARLEFAWPAQGDSKGLVSAVLRLERGDNLWSHELVTTRVEGRSARPSSEEYALFLRVEGAGVRGSIPIHTRDDGLFVLPAAPVGRATFVGVSISNGRWDERSTLAELDLVRGATAFVELP